MKLSIIGLGKLGTPLLAALIGAGFEVVGVDNDTAKIEALSAGQSPIDEPGVCALLKAHRCDYRVTQSTRDAVLDTEVTFVVVPTPSAPDGSFSLEHVLSACTDIGAALAEKDQYHLVAITSTVMPGDTATRIIPALECASGKREGVDFGVCYSPEFIALGNVLHGLTLPDMVLIGHRTGRAGHQLAGIVRQLTQFSAPIRHMSLESAELCKLSINTYVTMKIAFANTLAQICHTLPNADVEEVIGAMVLDRRISPVAFGAGAPFGGPCFPRDGVAFTRMAEQRGASTALGAAVSTDNQLMREFLLELIDERCIEGLTIAVLGMAYKPGTPVTEESAGVWLADKLREYGYQVRTYDPFAATAVIGAQRDVDAADVVVLMLPLEEFRELRWRRGQTVIDVWRMFKALPEGVNHLKVGHSNRSWYRDFERVLEDAAD